MKYALIPVLEEIKDFVEIGLQIMTEEEAEIQALELIKRIYALQFEH